MSPYFSAIHKELGKIYKLTKLKEVFKIINLNFVLQDLRILNRCSFISFCFKRNL